MIITENISYDSLKNLISKDKRTGIVACDSCSTACDTGGKKKLDEITLQLKNDGFDITYTDLFPMPCNVDSDQITGLDFDELLILACDAAVNAFKMMFPSKKVIPALNTMGIGAKDAKGNIFMIKNLKK